MKMNEVQANNYIAKIKRRGRSEAQLVDRIYSVTDDVMQTADILRAVEIYIDELLPKIVDFRNPTAGMTKVKQNGSRRQPAPNPGRKLKQTLNDPARAIDKYIDIQQKQAKRYVTKQRRKATRKAKTWARDNLARPVVAVALRIVGMEIEQ
jgi:hypothetical protein